MDLWNARKGFIAAFPNLPRLDPWVNASLPYGLAAQTGENGSYLGCSSPVARKAGTGSWRSCSLPDSPYRGPGGIASVANPGTTGGRTSPMALPCSVWTKCCHRGEIPATWAGDDHDCGGGGVRLVARVVGGELDVRQTGLQLPHPWQQPVTHPLGIVLVSLQLLLQRPILKRCADDEKAHHNPGRD
jgi:hypothetical protein